jgi:hypothetical protein
MCWNYSRNGRKEDKAEWWRRWIQLWYTVRSFANITMGLKYNNNMIIKEKQTKKPHFLPFPKKCCLDQKSHILWWLRINLLNYYYIQCTHQWDKLRGIKNGTEVFHFKLDTKVLKLKIIKKGNLLATLITRDHRT